VFHFCRLCRNNVWHDEADLKLHFKKEHKISVSKYYEQFKKKLKMPRLERPTATRASVNSNTNNFTNINNKDGENQTKQLKRKITDDNKAVTKKRKSAMN
jgi:hypothetical protein